MTALAGFIVTAWLGLVILAALADIDDLRIPNRISALIALLWPIHALAAAPAAGTGWLADAGLAIAVAAGVFAVGTGLFVFRWMGGGDVKLMAALSLWAGPALVLPFLVVTTLAGGALALLMATRLRFVVAGVSEWLGAADLRDRLLGTRIPYGVAIATGAVVVIAPALFNG
ncbi:MAG: pilus assembly protein CpaA [Rhodospirillales bacterium]|nr:MAG: pilus assembly protein CpaA [Rhodospirillales bacterium]